MYILANLQKLMHETMNCSKWGRLCMVDYLSLDFKLFSREGKLEVRVTEG